MLRPLTEREKRANARIIQRFHEFSTLATLAGVDNTPQYHEEKAVAQRAEHELHSGLTSRPLPVWRKSRK